MTSPQPSTDPAASVLPATADEKVTRWIGWVVFGGLVLLLAGVLNLLQGFVALVNRDHLAAASDLPVDVSYQVWGWLLIGLGALLAATGYGVLGGRTWARTVAVVVVALDALLNFAFARGYPFWSVLAITLNVTVLYALTVHGRESRILRP